MNLPASNCVLGALGFSKDLSREFYQKKSEIEKQQIIFRQNDPTPANYSVADDYDLIFGDCFARGIRGRQSGRQNRS